MRTCWFSFDGNSKVKKSDIIAYSKLKGYTFTDDVEKSDFVVSDDYHFKVFRISDCGKQRGYNNSVYKRIYKKYYIVDINENQPCKEDKHPKMLTFNEFIQSGEPLLSKNGLTCYNSYAFLSLLRKDESIRANPEFEYAISHKLNQREYNTVVNILKKSLRKCTHSLDFLQKIAMLSVYNGNKQLIRNIFTFSGYFLPESKLLTSVYYHQLENNKSKYDYDITVTPKPIEV